MTASKWQSCVMEHMSPSSLSPAPTDRQPYLSLCKRNVTLTNDKWVFSVIGIGFHHWLKGEKMKKENWRISLMRKVNPFSPERDFFALPILCFNQCNLPCHLNRVHASLRVEHTRWWVLKGIETGYSHRCPCLFSSLNFISLLLLSCMRLGLLRDFALFSFIFTLSFLHNDVDEHRFIG